MTLLYFAWVRQKIGKSEETVDLPESVTTVGALVEYLGKRGTGYADAFSDPKRLRAAVNQEHVQFDAPVTANDEVAFFPPGDGWMIRIQQDDFDVGAEVAALTKDRADIGAVAIFTGHVRADDGLIALILEHYPAMTEREIERHVGEAEKKWPLLGITIIHRVGRLMPGAQIVFVGVAATHRRAAFETCEFLMDYLKVRAPFWKQEERASGTVWVEAKASDEDAAGRWR